MKFKEEDLAKARAISAQLGPMLRGQVDDLAEGLMFYQETVPGMYLDWMMNGVVKFMEESTIDAKTRELILIGILAAMRCPAGVLFHVVLALNEGVPEEQIFDVLHLVAYEGAKVPLTDVGQMVQEGIKRFKAAGPVGAAA